MRWMRSRRSDQRGFTLLELLIAMVIMVLVMVGILNLFDRLNRLSRVQLNLAEMQQGLRVGQRELAHMTRMAGRGGLDGLRHFADSDAGDARTLRGPALQVRNNVPAADAEREVVQGQNGALALEGTDILIVRGVFSTPIYVVDTEAPNDFNLAPPQADGHTGTVTIRSQTPTGVVQDLAPLQEALTNNVNEALVLVDALNPTAFEVARLNPGGSTSAAGSITLAFSTRASDGDAQYFKLLSSNGGAPVQEFRYGASYVAILEEYRYYIREEFAIAGDNSSELLPKLSYARVFPGTERLYRDDPANLAIDIADNIFDLQIALGFDSSADGLANGQVVETADGTDDDWLFNAADDTAKFTGNTPPWDGSGINGLHYARITTLGRAAETDPNYLNPQPLVALEDHDYSSSNPKAYNLFNGTTVGLNGDSADARTFRRQILQTTVDLRNVK